jgi:serine phosphatase RsbU (regulator of sigma subunit)
VFLVLEPCDILLAYTDGISEAVTAGDEEWGEDRVIAAAQACRDLPAAEMIDGLIAAADAFTAGAQHDDMTLVVVTWLGKLIRCGDCVGALVAIFSKAARVRCSPDALAFT